MAALRIRSSVISSLLLGSVGILLALSSTVPPQSGGGTGVFVSLVLASPASGSGRQQQQSPVPTSSGRQLQHLRQETPPTRTVATDDGLHDEELDDSRGQLHAHRTLTMMGSDADHSGSGELVGFVDHDEQHFLSANCRFYGREYLYRTDRDWGTKVYTSNLVTICVMNQIDRSIVPGLQILYSGYLLGQQEQSKDQHIDVFVKFNGYSSSDGGLHSLKQSDDKQRKRWYIVLGDCSSDPSYNGTTPIPWTNENRELFQDVLNHREPQVWNIELAFVTNGTKQWDSRNAKNYVFQIKPPLSYSDVKEHASIFGDVQQMIET